MQFDIEKARAGEPVEYGTSTEWEPCRFLGISESSDGYIVVERINRGGFQLSYASPSQLRMAAKKVKVRYRNYKLCDAVAAGVSMIVDGPGRETPEAIEKRSWFRGWIHTDWQEAEVEQ